MNNEHQPVSRDLRYTVSLEMYAGTVITVTTTAGSIEQALEYAMGAISHPEVVLSATVRHV